MRFGQEGSGRSWIRKAAVGVAALFFVLSGLPVGLAGERAEGYRVESIGPATDSSLAESIRSVLSPSGIRVVNGGGSTVCELWLRREIPASAEEVSGAFFSKIGEGTFVGLAHFPKNGGDFRGQGLAAGWYTMRYAMILQDGNHLGVSPSRDFLLFSRVSDDSDPGRAFPISELYQKSRAAAGTGHPSSWSLVFPTEEKGLPRVVTNHEEHVILEMQLPTAGAPTTVGMILIGKTEG